MNVQDIATDRAAPSGTPLSHPRQTPAPQPNGVSAIIQEEIIGGLTVWPVWFILGWDDIRQRYRRSVLGPFWITLSMGVFILLLGIIYSRLFHTDLETYLPYLTAGYVIWGFMSAATLESCIAFHESAGMIKQIKLPYSVYILRVVWRNFIVFLHTAVIFIPVAIIFHVKPTWSTFYLVTGLFLLIVNVAWVAMILAILSTRYRDITSIITTLVQVTLFATPIMWPVNSLNGARFIAEINPVYHLIELVRAPMLGETPEVSSWLVGIGLAVVGCVLAAALLVSKSRRIVFWV
jgi:ABC-type polysaccharide/polyol phosphate export permease